MATHSSVLPWEIPWTEEPGSRQGCKESDTTEWLKNKNKTWHSQTNKYQGKKRKRCSKYSSLLSFQKENEHVFLLVSFQPGHQEQQPPFQLEAPSYNSQATWACFQKRIPMQLEPEQGRNPRLRGGLHAGLLLAHKVPLRRPVSYQEESNRRERHSSQGWGVDHSSRFQTTESTPVSLSRKVFMKRLRLPGWLK